MRYLTSPAGYIAIVLAVIGLAGAATFNLYVMSGKPDHDWDPEIDRIVAQYHERKGSHTLIARANAAEDAKPSLNTADPETKMSEIPPSTEASASPAEDPAQVQDEIAKKQAQNAVQSTKRLNRRAGRRNDQFLPAPFASLPKFAVSAPKTAVYTIRRLW